MCAASVPTGIGLIFISLSFIKYNNNDSNNNNSDNNDYGTARAGGGGGEIFRSRPERTWGTPSLLYNGYRVFPGVKAAGMWR